MSVSLHHALHSDLALADAMLTADPTQLTHRYGLWYSAACNADPVAAFRLLARHGYHVSNATFMWSIVSSPKFNTPEAVPFIAHLAQKRKRREVNDIFARAMTESQPVYEYVVRGLVRGGANPAVAHNELKRARRSPLQMRVVRYAQRVANQRCALCALIGARRYRRSPLLAAMPLDLVVQIARNVWFTVD